MAMSGNPGVNFKIGGNVDPAFLQGVAQAKESTTKANTEGRNWGTTLKALGGTLGGAARAVGALVIEQKLHSAQVAASVKATTDQMAAYQKLQSQALAPLAQSLQSLIALQEKQLAVMSKGSTGAVAQAVQSNTTMADSVKSLGGVVDSSSIHFDTLRYAAQNVFSGDLMGAVQTLGSHLANFSGILIGVTAAVGFAKSAMDAYEEVQKATGKAIEEESLQIAKATARWTEYAGAIEKASGKSKYLAGLKPSDDWKEDKPGALAMRAATQLILARPQNLGGLGKSSHALGALTPPSQPQSLILGDLGNRPAFSGGGMLAPLTPQGGLQRNLWGYQGPQDPNPFLSRLSFIGGKVDRVKPIDAYSQFEKDATKAKSNAVQDKVAADLSDNSAMKAKAQEVLSRLRVLKKSHAGVLSTKEPLAEEMSLALGKTEAFQIAKQSDANVPIRFKSQELDIAIKRQKEIFEKLSESNKAIEAYKVQVDKVASGLNDSDAKMTRITEAGNTLKGLGSRQYMVDAKSYTADSLKEMQEKYSTITGGKTDDASLAKVLTGKGSKGQRDLAKDLLATRKLLTEQSKAIADFDIEADRKAIEAGRLKVQNLESQLALRKALGTSSTQDVADTLKAELSVVSPKDSASRTSILNKQTEEHGKWLSENLKDYVSDDVEAYKLLQSTGTATAAQLDTANKKVTKSVKDWVAAQGEVLEQYPKIRKEADALANSAKQEGNRIKTKAFDEHYSDLKGKIAKDDNAALNNREKMAANQRSVESTNAALNSGIITQKQHTEELATLEKERANLQRTITSEIEAQKKAIDIQKVSLAKDRLSRYAGAVARGEGGAFATDKKESLTKEVLSAELKAIDDEYQAAIKGGKDQVLAAEDASLKKKRLWESETEKFRAEQDAQTNAQKQADKDRVGGSASPLVGLNEGAAFSGLKFSGFKSFGEGFGKFAQRRTAFDDFQATQLPDNINSMFKQQQTYERPAAKAGGDTYHVHVDPQWVNPATQQLLEQVGRAMGEAASRRALRVGPGAPSMTRDSVAQ